MESCIFCKIATKDTPAKIFYEDEHALAFPNKNPVVDGHVMVISKKHATNMLDIDTYDPKALVESTQVIAKRVVKDYKAAGFNLLMANGKVAQQSVDHYHWHIVPRYPNDGLDLWIKHGL